MRATVTAFKPLPKGFVMCDDVVDAIAVDIGRIDSKGEEGPVLFGRFKDREGRLPISLFAPGI